MLAKCLVVLVGSMVVVVVVVRAKGREGQGYEGWRLVRFCGSSRALKKQTWLESLKEEGGDREGLLWLGTHRDAVDVALSPNVSLSNLVKSPARASDPTRHSLSTGGPLLQHDPLAVCQGCPDTEGGRRRGRKPLKAAAGGGEIGCQVILQDVSSLIAPTSKAAPQERMSWEKYHRYSTLTSFVKDLASQNDMVEMLSLGRTAEGRQITALIIGTNSKQLAEEFNEQSRAIPLSERRQALITSTGSRQERKKKKKKKKQLVYIEAGSHAREWIAPAVATYLAQQAGDAGKGLLRSVTFIIVPLANPDGYEYTHTSNRFWRKNRRVNSGSQCVGVDPNRNWDIAWGGVGSSGNPCSDIYRGTEAFSEEETMSLGFLGNVFKDNITMFMSVHCYGKLLIHPWAHTTQRSRKYKKLQASAKRITRTLNQFDYKYTFGQTATLLYRASGGSDDYMHHQGVDVAFTLELPDTSFVLPASEILPVAKQTWAGLMCEVARVARNKKAKKMCKQLLP